MEPIFDFDCSNCAQLKMAPSWFDVALEQETMVFRCRERLSSWCQFMGSIVCIEIAQGPRRPDVNVDQTAKRFNRFFSVTSSSKLTGCPDDLLFVGSFSSGVVVPSENPDVCTPLPVDFEEASMLKPVHGLFLSVLKLFINIAEGKRQAVPEDWSFPKTHSSRNDASNFLKRSSGPGVNLVVSPLYRQVNWIRQT